ncbi:MAG: LysR family transcriptional regulator [Burkholderiales bacterium]|nr:LysR family transcriptional regulator [Burkholderiales bacterium]
MARSSLDLSQALGHEAADKRIDILRRIGEVGSISEAARGAGVSYKAAWQAVETLGNLAGQALVQKAVGGSGGGGAQLTPAGEKLLEAAGLLARARAAVLASLNPRSGIGPQGLVGLGLRTSMRNQLPCTVASLAVMGHGVRVGLTLPDGSLLHARITQESSELLGLQPGVPALALCKAAAVGIARKVAPREGLNALQGEVARAMTSADDREVSLLVMPGLRLVGFTAGAARLKVGQRAMAAVEESAVVIAVGS